VIKNTLHKIENYTMKCRLYPNKEQAEKIDIILDGMRVAHNVTMYEMNQHNPMVTREKDGTFWPDFKAMGKKSWLDFLRENYPIVKEVPATSLSSNNGMFLCDCEKAWEKKGKLPVGKWKVQFYGQKKPRNSFLVQVTGSGFKETGNEKAFRMNIPKCGAVKVRGFNNNLRFDPDGTIDLFNFMKTNRKRAFTVKVSKDNCSQYWICISFPIVYKPVKIAENRIPIGVDVGIKDIAILSSGRKYENKRFKNGADKEVKRHRKFLHRRLSRRYGWSNIEFRKAHKSNKEIVPSKRYERTRMKLARLERKIANRRENWNNFISMDIVRTASVIGIETLSIRNMFRNRHLADALSDASMSTLLGMIQYKSSWYGTECRQIGRWMPSSKTCSVCGYVKKDMTLKDREWKCPECGTMHDRDINAAMNILKYATC